MAVTNADLKYFYSGGSSNSNGKLSIGGAVGAEITSSMTDIFDEVTELETDAGMTDYRLIYVKNDSDSNTLLRGRYYFTKQPNDTDVTLESAAASEAASANPSVAAIATENTAPAGPLAFTESTLAAPTALGDIPSNQYKGVWIMRMVASGSGAKDVETAEGRFFGGSGE